jgi:hypothetical protein
VPIARYFVVVGSVLVVLLLIAGWSLPEPRPSFADRPEIIDRAIIRIRSERKWPEKVVLDTHQPTFLPPSIAVAAAQQAAEAPLDEMTDQTRADALVKPNPDARPIDAHHQPVRAKSRTARAFRSIHLARARNRNERPTLARGFQSIQDGSQNWPWISKISAISMN